MEKKRTLYEYLYQCLREQILTGYLGYGDTLPSLNQLCDIYHVGIRTAKDVLKDLKDEGLIRTEERRPSVVIYRPCTGALNEAAIQTVMEKKTSILQVYETMTLLMPCLFSFSAQVCGAETLEHCFQQLKKSSRKSLRIRWKASSVALHSLLDASDNLLFRDIFTSLEICARVPFFLDCTQSEFFASAYKDYKDPMWMMDAVNRKHPREIHRCFTGMYRSITSAVRQYLDDLSSHMTVPIMDDPDYYTWSAEQGRDHYYMQITRDLIDKIGTGYYKDRSYLPPEAALAEEYQVSVSTIRKALAVLNKTGFCQTYNVRGTQVTLFNDDATLQCMKNKVFKKDTLLYLSGLQFMAIAVYPAAVLAFDFIDSASIERLKQDMKKNNVIPLDLLVQCIIDHLPLQPYKVILTEVKEMLHWGYYYSFYSEGLNAADALYQKSMKAFRCLAFGEKERFADQLSQCYCHMLEFVRNFLTGCGLPEAAVLATPHPGTY